MSESSPEEQTEVDFQAILQKIKNMNGNVSSDSIFLVGDIVEPNLGFTMIQLAQAEKNWINTGNDELRNVSIKLTSTGGSIRIGFALYDLLRNTPLNICIEGYGYVCSAAVLVLMGGDSRGMSKNTRLMLHEAFVSMDDSMNLTKKGLTAHRTELNILFSNYCKILAKRSGQPISKIKELCEKETYLSAKEALKLGLIDFIC
jgi:ATP-dependent Clp protease, protease subunit